MADLLLHSMSEFTDLILPALELTGARSIVEVGSEYGTMTTRLLEHADSVDGHLTVIDPNPDPDAEQRIKAEPRAELKKCLSLEALPGLHGDAWLIDGDHNYYTVIEESRLIWEQSRSTNTPFLVFYHDVGWPWGRRDLYYNPDTIPVEHRQRYSWQQGVIPGDPGVVEGGFRGEGNWAPALQEGGPRNGVLTAVEDFAVGKEDDLLWAFVPAVFGLGVLFDAHAPWTDSLRHLVAPYHMNPILTRMEQNRLDLYLTVIAWQDREQAGSA